MDNRTHTKTRLGGNMAAQLTAKVCAVTLLAFLSIGWSSQERSVIDRAKVWKQKLKPDAMITVSCKGTATQCTYPDASGNQQWGCTIGLDVNEDGKVDKVQALYGHSAEAELLKCRN